jgi:acyl-CoA synthetase (AMP-forming)/AMP-acid ligase II
MIAPLYFYNDCNLAQTFCITSEQQAISYAQFWQDVVEQSVEIENLQQDTWALWEQDSYEFIVLLFAALLAKKRIILPPNRVRDLEQKLAQQDIHFLGDSL